MAADEGLRAQTNASKSGMALAVMVQPTNVATDVVTNSSYPTSPIFKPIVSKAAEAPKAFVADETNGPWVRWINFCNGVDGAECQTNNNPFISSFLHKKICVVELEGNVGVFPRVVGITQGNLDAMLAEFNKFMERPSGQVAECFVPGAIGGTPSELKDEVYKGGQLSKKDQEEMAVKAMLADRYGHGGKISTGAQAVAAHLAAMAHKDDGDKFNTQVPTNKKIDPSSHIARRANMKTAHSRALDEKTVAALDTVEQKTALRRPTGSSSPNFA